AVLNVGLDGLAHPYAPHHSGILPIMDGLAHPYAPHHSGILPIMGRWVLRHYRRGGLIAKLSQDSYLWTGAARTRSFAEWRLLAELRRRGLRVPAPIAARYVRGLFTYR